MQEIREFQRENGVMKELRERIVGHESPELIKAFTARREALEARLASGETESATVRESRRIGFEDDCPCGSKEQFRNCCGKRLADSEDNRIAPAGLEGKS